MTEHAPGDAAYQQRQADAEYVEDMIGEQWGIAAAIRAGVKSWCRCEFYTGEQGNGHCKQCDLSVRQGSSSTREETT